jgi:hypothetical protein
MFEESKGKYKGRELIGCILKATEEEVKRYIIDELNKKREYHGEDKFTEEHIKNIFKQKNMYINKEIMKWLKEEGFVK